MNWINTRYKLPNDKQRVIIYFEHHTDGNVLCAVFSKKYGWRVDIDGEGLGNDITYWQPLPEAPSQIYIKFDKLNKN